jgi:hypothetical protein
MEDNDGICEHNLFNSVLLLEEESFNLFWRIQIQGILDMTSIEFIVEATVDD